MSEQGVLGSCSTVLPLYDSHMSTVVSNRYHHALATTYDLTDIQAEYLTKPKSVSERASATLKERASDPHPLARSLIGHPGLLALGVAVNAILSDSRKPDITDDGL